MTAAAWDERHLALLSELGADRVSHSGRTLQAHLLGTARLLASWGAGRDLTLAGLFHSLYGTSTFRTRLLDRAGDRARLSALIGDRAESLVHLFGGPARPARLREGLLPAAVVERVREELPSSKAVSELARDLIELECANLLEQDSFHGSTFSGLVHDALETGSLVLRDPVRSALTPVGWPPRRSARPQGPITIRAATAQDLPRLVALMRELVVHSRYVRCWFDAQVARATVDRYLTQEGHAIWLCHRGEDLAGFAAIHLQPPLFSRERCAHVDALYVRPQAAGVCGLRLLLQARHWARRMQAHELVVATDAGGRSQRVNAFLQRVGMPAVGQLHALWLR